MRFEAGRAHVLRTCIELADRGYLAGTGGNVALLVDREHFAVTPSATGYYEMTAGDVCIVRLQDGAQVAGEKTASVEAGLHASVLRARPDCAASIHTHQPIASAYTLLGIPLEIRSEAHRRLLGPQIECVGYAPSGTSRLARRVAQALDPDVHACLMRNHGAVCIGRDSIEAMSRVEALESACAAFFLDRAISNPTGLEASVAALVTSTLRSALAADPTP